MTVDREKYAESQDGVKSLCLQSVQQAERKHIKAETCFHRITNLVCYVAVAFMTICFLVAGAAQAQTGHKRNVLVLNSYHQGYYWSDQIMDAIQAELDRTDIKVELFFVYGFSALRYRRGLFLSERIMPVEVS